MDIENLKNKFLNLLYKHTYVLPSSSVKRLILRFDKAATYEKKEKLYNMLLEFGKLGVSTIKDLRDIKRDIAKYVGKPIPEPVYEKEIILKENKEKKNMDEDIINEKINTLRTELKKKLYTDDVRRGSEAYKEKKKQMDELKEKIKELLILKNGGRELERYDIYGDMEKKGLGIKKNKKNNNSYLSLLKSMI